MIGVMKGLRLTFRRIGVVITGVLAFPCGVAGQFLEWTAFNDQIAGSGTGVNATSWGVFANSSGPMRRVTSGEVLPVVLTISHSGAVSSSTMGVPDAGTPAAVVFGGQIEWGSMAGEGVQLGTTASATWVISGLDPARRYTFRGTSVRGDVTYGNRWTRAELQGAVSFVNAHTAGVATTATVGALTAAQAAWNSGNNRAGDMVGWDLIHPGSDGAITVVCRRHSGAYPAVAGQAAGNTETPTVGGVGYGFQAIRLEQWNPVPPPPPVAVADEVTVHAGRKVRIPVLANDTGLIGAPTVTLVDPPAGGRAVVGADGSVLFTAGQTSEGFRYRVRNAGGDSNVAAVTVTVSPALRIAPRGFVVPENPPATSWALSAAFGGLAFSQPVCLASPPGDARRLFVCEKGGRLRVVPDVTAAVPATATFLDVATLLTGRGESLVTSSEMGLLGVAFHPAYAENRFFYVFYSVRKADGLNYERLARFTADPADAGRALTTSERILIEQRDEATNHNGGDLHFGPDGYLYVSLGDEGNQDDSLNNSQTLTKDFFSGVLRIDVDRRVGSVEPSAHPAVLRDGGVARYAVPVDNPWVHTSLGGSWNGVFNGSTISNLATVRTEFWATGLRNPWRMSFDPATGELWCGDVGGNLREEVNVLSRGGNYGWAFREGTVNGPKSGSAPAGFASLAPLYNYQRGTGTFQGNSITGGVVYRGKRFGALEGLYVFADYTSGNVWSLRRNGAAAPTVTRIAGEGGIVAFGRDPANGDVLLADIDNNVIRRLAAVTVAGSYPETLTATGLFADLTDLAPQPGLLPYEVNLPFWSDHALKRRWMALPGPDGRIGWSRDGLWSFPSGTIWVKHFDMEMERGNAATRRRLETRLLVKNAGGAYGVSYRWNEAGSEAVLAPDEGVDLALTVTAGGQSVAQNWRIPSRAECMVCHTSQAGFALSSGTRQWNLAGDINGFRGNQIDVMAAGGCFSGSPAAGATLPRHARPDETAVSLEGRVRSWLAVNCAYCHMAGGSAPAGFDVSPGLPLALTGLLNGAAVNNGGDSRNRLIVPGSTARSVVFNRAAAAGGFTRMPPIGSSVSDPDGMALLAEWIGQRLPGREDYAAWRAVRFSGRPEGEGDPAADPDGDGVGNREEFLAGTDPLVASSRPVVTGEVGAEGTTLRFEVPENRSWQLECSADLGGWVPWAGGANHGLPAAGGGAAVRVPNALPREFFRVRFSEN
jgi:glucose/arabinose dehydrogenase